jgi:hypothetical protein
MFRPYNLVIIRPIQNKSLGALYILGSQLCITFGLSPKITVSWMWIFLISVETVIEATKQTLIYCRDYKLWLLGGVSGVCPVLPLGSWQGSCGSGVNLSCWVKWVSCEQVIFARSVVGYVNYCVRFWFFFNSDFALLREVLDITRFIVACVVENRFF